MPRVDLECFGKRIDANEYAVIICMFMLATGCDRPSAAVVRIEVERPGTDAVAMDEMVAFPLMIAINGAPHITDIQSLSFAGKTQIFVTLANSDSIDAVWKRVRIGLTGLPNDCHLLSVDPLNPGESIPSPEPGDSEYVDIRVKPDEVLKNLGISSADVKLAIGQATSKSPPTDSLETLKTIEVNLGGRQFLLKDIADIQIVIAPKCIPRGHFKGTR